MDKGLRPLIVRLNNFQSKQLAPVGTYSGISKYGVYDLGGNAREWVSNQQNDRNYIYWK